MKNPLNKRYARDLKKEIVKYLAIFLFMSLTIGFISGFLIAGDSMKKAYDESFEKYDIENGHFVVDTKLKTTDIRDIENNDVTIHEMFYYNLEVNNDSVLRTFKNRKEVNKVCVMKGELPSSVSSSTEVWKLVDRLDAYRLALLSLAGSLETAEIDAACRED